MFAKIGYDPHKDFEPVTLAVTTTNVLMTNPSVPAKSINELLDLVRANPGKYTFASPGAGTPAHLVGEKLRLSRSLDLTHVPFGGARRPSLRSWQATLHWVSLRYRTPRRL
jgi:tripartite-type tricarboxylate transporter receptor subunit TctC